MTNEQLIGIASSQAAKYAADLSSHVKRGMKEAALPRGDWMGHGLRLDGYAPLFGEPDSREARSRRRRSRTRTGST